MKGGDFKYALRACRIAKHKPDALASAPKVLENIWKGNRKAMLPSTMVCATGNEAVAEMWKKHFETLLSPSINNNIGTFVNENLENYEDFQDIFLCATVANLNS